MDPAAAVTRRNPITGMAGCGARAIGHVTAVPNKRDKFAPSHVPL